ncbi:hypothetical protein HGRIS_006868 [Hohenbuehelia grisea]|uniref:F-box domain-containing protein n=1 Tax=Hohenbuehelia grisea TaxID=104357 RepID=A0ABR3JAL4_9AGAR
MAMASLTSMPHEVLEHIAFFVATETFLGPPTPVVPLVSACRLLNSCLSITHNHLLYARIFAHKYDILPALRRFGAQQPSPSILAAELQRRCFFLNRMRRRLDSLTNSTLADNSNENVRSVLWTAYLMMLENDGKNEEQLRGYGRIDEWLHEYWFSEGGASGSVSAIKANNWPSNTEQTSLAMWLFWFLLKPEKYLDNASSWKVVNVLKIFALAAHKYNLTSPSWIEFVPKPHLGSSKNTMYYLGSHPLTPPPLAAPAILSFLTLVNKMLESPSTLGYAAVTRPSISPSLGPCRSLEWECEWGRCISLGQAYFNKFLTDSYKPGSVEGVWEGMFTYTEFTAYSALLSGAPPPVLEKSMVVRHRQTWKLREYHLLSADPSHSDSGIEMDSDNVDPIPAGDPLRSYFPTGTHISEHPGWIEVRESRDKPPLLYHRAASARVGANDADCKGQSCVLDVIITGEGHSAWGQFNLVGRIRPCDGFISLCKEYVDGDRGRWLYRGYLVGTENGNLAGRWRDTLSPAEVPGYEGCFTMSRRR